MADHALGTWAHYSYAYWLNMKYLLGAMFGHEGTEQGALDGYPLPPIPLRYRVHGSVKPEGFLRVGRCCAQDVEKILEENGHSFSTIEKVLDFGCGCGRVLRFLSKDGSHAERLYGTDIDPQAIRWCKKHLPLANWDVNKALPPTRYESDTFDFIFAISVFTHLDEQYQNAWLQELRRILKPKGLLLATVHGEQFSDKVRKEHAEILSKAGFLNEVGRTGALKLDGLPDYYQTTFHSRSYVERVWGELFEVASYKEKGMNGHQDAVLLRRRTAS